MRKRRTGRIILLILLALFLVFAVPIIINESYKANDGYVTMWEAADVLSYYGIILGALITVFALTTTIRFTKKQIQRNSYLNGEKEKWNKIESEVVKALDEINPARVSELINRALAQDRDEIIVSIRSCMLRADTVGDALRGYISEEDSVKLEPLLASIKEYSAIYSDIAGKLTMQFLNLQLLDKAKQVNEKIRNINHPADRLNFQLASGALFAAVKGLSVDDVTKEINSLGEQLNQLRESKYLGLLDQKREVFADVQKHIEQNANEILSLWGK